MRGGQRTLQPQSRKRVLCQNLALNGDLMFDQDDVLQRVKEILW
jgi:hypothetical protein